MIMNSHILHEVFKLELKLNSNKIQRIINIELMGLFLMKIELITAPQLLYPK